MLLKRSLGKRNYIVDAIGKRRRTVVEIMNGETENTRFKLPPEVVTNSLRVNRG